MITLQPSVGRLGGEVHEAKHAPLLTETVPSEGGDHGVVVKLANGVVSVSFHFIATYNNNANRSRKGKRHPIRV